MDYCKFKLIKTYLRRSHENKDTVWQDETKTLKNKNMLWQDETKTLKNKNMLLQDEIKTLKAKTCFRKGASNTKNKK